MSAVSFKPVSAVRLCLNMNVCVMIHIVYTCTYLPLSCCLFAADIAWGDGPRVVWDPQEGGGSTYCVFGCEGTPLPTATWHAHEGILQEVGVWSGTCVLCVLHMCTCTSCSPQYVRFCQWKYVELLTPHQVSGVPSIWSLRVVAEEGCHCFTIQYSTSAYVHVYTHVCRSEVSLSLSLSLFSRFPSKTSASTESLAGEALGKCMAVGRMTQGKCQCVVFHHLCVLALVWL